MSFFTPLFPSLIFLRFITFFSLSSFSHLPDSFHLPSFILSYFFTSHSYHHSLLFFSFLYSSLFYACLPLHTFLSSVSSFLIPFFLFPHFPFLLSLFTPLPSPFFFVLSLPFSLSSSIYVLRPHESTHPSPCTPFFLFLFFSLLHPSLTSLLPSFHPSLSSPPPLIISTSTSTQTPVVWTSVPC